MSVSLIPLPKLPIPREQPPMACRCWPVSDSCSSLPPEIVPEVPREFSLTSAAIARNSFARATGSACGNQPANHGNRVRTRRVNFPSASKCNPTDRHDGFARQFPRLSNQRRTNRPGRASFVVVWKIGPNGDVVGGRFRGRPQNLLQIMSRDALPIAPSRRSSAPLRRQIFLANVYAAAPAMAAMSARSFTMNRTCKRAERLTISNTSADNRGLQLLVSVLNQLHSR